MASEPNNIANLSIDSLNNDDFLHVNSPVGMNLYEIYEKCTTFNFCSFKYSDHDAGDFDNNIRIRIRISLLSGTKPIHACVPVQM